MGAAVSIEQEAIVTSRLDQRRATNDARPDAAPTNQSPIFVGGCPRSGTTLLRAMLDAHPNIACGPEMRAIAPLAKLSSDMRALMGGTLRRHYDLDEAASRAIFAALIDGFLTPYRAARGKPRIAEKTPANALHYGELAKLFPNAAFIQIVRDGRDVVASLLRMAWTDAAGRPAAVRENAATAAHVWLEHVRRGRLAAVAGARYFEVRYESLVREPRATMGSLIAFLGEPWSDDVLTAANSATVDAGVAETSAEAVKQPLTDASIGRWRRDLSPEDLTLVERVAWPLLRELGYAGDA